MRVDAIEELSALTRAQLGLLDDLLRGGWPDLEALDDPHKAAALAALWAAPLDVDRETLVVYRLSHRNGERSILVAPRNRAVKPGTVVVCTGETAFLGWFSADEETPGDVLHAASGIEPCDLDL